jgi:hypothetical protein
MNKIFGRVVGSGAAVAPGSGGPSGAHAASSNAAQPANRPNKNQRRIVVLSRCRHTLQRNAYVA